MRPAVPFVVVLAVCALPAAAADAPNARVVVARESAPTYPILGGKGEATLLLNAETGSKEAALSLLTLAPGAEVLEHLHEGSAELLYIEAGACELTVGGVKVQAGPGSAVRIPAGVKHSARVTSAVQSLRAVQVYVGPGPEQRFRGGPSK